MSFKSDNHRKWYFANKDNLPSSDSSIEGYTSKRVHDTQWTRSDRERLMVEESLIQKMHPNAYKNK